MPRMPHSGPSHRSPTTLTDMATIAVITGRTVSPTAWLARTKRVDMPNAISPAAYQRSAVAVASTASPSNAPYPNSVATTGCATTMRTAAMGASAARTACRPRRISRRNSARSSPAAPMAGYSGTRRLATITDSGRLTTCQP